MIFEEYVLSFAERPAGTPDSRVVVTQPLEASESPDYSPFEATEPGELVFCCFFRTEEQRTAFLDRLRSIAREKPPAEDEQARLQSELETEYDRSRSAGDTEAAFFYVVRWWVNVRRQVYHAYSLRIAAGPYRTSALVAFEEQEGQSIRYNMALAVDALEEEKTRIMDFFGLQGE